MGGLVARYGLAQMVSENTPTETRVFVSYDSPHRGANVPLGLQATLNDFYRAAVAGIPLRWIAPVLGDGKKALESMAARQMLLVRDDNLGTDFLRTEYRQMVDRGLGRCRMVAISKGSACGLPQLRSERTGRNGTDVLQAGDELLRGKGNFFVNRIAFTIAQTVIGGALTVVPVVGIALSSVFLGVTTVINILFADIDRKLDITIRALPDRRVAQVFHTKLEASSTLFGIRLFTVTEFEYSRNSQATHLAYDTGAGGAYYLGILNGKVDNINAYPILEFDVNISNSLYFCFIPTASALDAEVTAQSLVAAFHSNTSFLTPSPFQEFITENTTIENRCFEVRGGFCTRLVALTVNNTTHNNSNWFDARSAEWFFNIIENQPQTINVCNVNCPLQLEMTVPNAICATPARATLSVTQIPNVTYRWTWDNDNVGWVSGVGTSTLVVASNGTYNGWVNFTATVIGQGCLNTSITRRVWVGAMTQITDIDNNPVYDQYITYQDTYSLRNDQAQGANIIRWFVSRNGNTPREVLAAANRRQLSFGVRVLPGTCENITVSVFADNGCSQSTFSENFEYCLDAGLPRCNPFDIGGRAINLTFSVFPNPTSGNVVLSFENLSENQPHSTNNISTIFVSNSLGSKVLTINNPILTQNDNKTYTTLNLSNLPDGLYFVTVVFENGSVISQKVMV
jgi:hypothetical protein